MAISEQWAELLEPGLRSIFEVQSEALAAEAVAPRLFNVIPSNKASEYFLGLGGFADWQKYEGAITYDNNDQLYKTTLTPDEYTDGFKVERKLVDDDMYNIISARPKGLAIAAARTREKAAADVFNNAFAGTSLGADGVDLCSTAHPYSPTNSGTTHGNEGTSVLNYENLVTTRRLMREFVDDRGELVAIHPDTLLVPPELEETASTILNTMNKPDITDYHDNFIGSRINRLVVWDYLTDANNWFVLDSTLAKIHLLWVERTATEFALDPTSNFRLEARFRGYMRWATGWSDWRFLYGHAVA